MDSCDDDVACLRSHSTLSLNNNNDSERKSSRIHAIESVKAATRKLKSSSTQSLTTIRKKFSNEIKSKSFHGSVGKSTEMGLMKKQLSLQNPPISQTCSIKRLQRSHSENIMKKQFSNKDKRKKIRQLHNGKELWFSKGSHVAVLINDGAKFYLCRLQQNIFNSTKETRIRWLSVAGVRFYPNIYRSTYLDKIDPASILMEVELSQKSRLTYLLPDYQQKEIEKMIALVEDIQSGKLAVQDIEDVDVQEVVQIEEPPRKKPKTVRNKALKIASKVSKSTSKAKVVKVKQTKEKQPKRKLPQKVDELKLHPRPEIKVLDKDPLFESREPMPYVSKVSNSKLIFRAINLGDVQMLKKLLRDGDRIKRLHYKSVDHPVSPLEAGGQVTNKDILTVLLDEYVCEKFKKRMIYNPDDTQCLAKLETGSYNKKSLGISYIRNIQASRGSKEGNNAFVKIEDYFEISSWKDCLDPSRFDEFESYVKNQQSVGHRVSLHGPHDIIKLLLQGQNKTAGNIMKQFRTPDYFGANLLMRQVLLNENEDLMSCPPSAVKHYSKRLSNITPIHCAAVNPNEKYLNKLLSVEPNAQVTDSQGRRPIHYAACCSRPENVKLLLSWGAGVSDTCTGLKIPLHYAILAKRKDNVQALLQSAKARTSDPSIERYGAGGVNRPMKNSLIPLHIAAESEQVEIARILLAHGASVNARTSVSNLQRNPLQMAAQTGNIEMVKLLIDHGAIVEQKDRLGRTALVLACKNGATKVLSYLVHIGANPERADSSGNTPLHYAAAYGWYFTVKFLIEIGVDMNATNIWKVTPLSVAYMKGHVGIVRELLNNDKININQTLNDGTTLLFHACESDLTEEDLSAQIQYLVKEKGALCDITDVSGKTALFYLANADISDYKKQKEGFAQSVKIAKLLLDNGCDIHTVDDNGYTALMTVLGKVSNIPLAEFLIKKGCKIIAPPEGERRDTLLHEINENFDSTGTDLPKVIEILSQSSHIKGAKEMAKCYDTTGYTPLLDMCSRNFYWPIEKMSENQKNFQDYIKFLVNTLQSDVNAIVKKKIFPPETILPPLDSNNWYNNIYHAKCTPLMLMIQNQSKNTTIAEDIKFLVENGTDVNAVNFWGHTPLTICVNEKCTNLILYLGTLEQCDIDKEVLLHGSESKIHPFHLALNSHDTILALIDIGCDVNILRNGEKPATFLHEVFQINRLDKQVLLSTLEKLETSKVAYDFNQQDWKGKHPLHYAARNFIGGLETSLELEYKLIQHGSKVGLQDKKGRTPLHYAFKCNKARSENTDPVQLVQMICKTMTVKEINAKDIDGKTALHMAAELGATLSCVYMLKDSKADISLCDLDGNTALTLAVANAKDVCAMSLMQNGANLKDQVIKLSNDEKKDRKAKRRLALKADNVETHKNDNEQTPWILEIEKHVKAEERLQMIPLYKEAMKNGLQGVVMLLSQADKQKSGLIPLDVLKMAFDACFYNIAIDVLYTVQIHMSQIRKLDQAGRNLLHLLAVSCEKNKTPTNPTICKMALILIKEKIPLEQADEFGFYPIHYAVMNRHFDLADLLAEHGTSYDKDPNGRGFSYMEAALWRIYSRKFDDLTWSYLEKLFDKGMDIDQHIYFPLYPDLVKLYQDRHIKDPDWSERKDTCATTALITAIRCTPFAQKRAKGLLKRNASPNGTDGNQVTPLMHAVMQNDANFVKLLLNHDYPDIKDDAIETTPKRTLNTSIFRLKPKTDDNDSDSGNDSDSFIEDSKESDNKDGDLKPVKKTSDLNLDAKDKNGRTALHYLASSPEGTFDNKEIAFLLVKAGAKELKDKSGQTPYALAVKVGALQVADMLKSHGHGKHEKCHTNYQREFPVDDGINFKDKNKPDFINDAENFLKCMNTQMEVDEEFVHKVDKNCSVQNGVLLKDEELDVWYDVLMTKVDVKRSVWGLYNFYKIQLIHQPNPSLYILFTCWGCIGEGGQFQQTPFSDLKQAVKEFCKIFRQKSGNKWTDVKQFDKKPNKYRLLDDPARQAPAKMDEIDIDVDSDVPSILPVYLLSVMKQLMDPKSLIQAMKRMQKLNTESLPFGQLKKERLLQGKNLLNEIRKYVTKVTKYRSINEADKTEEERAEYHKICEMIAKLSTEYFHVIPQNNFALEDCRPLDALPQLNIHTQVVDNLLEYEVACKMLFGAMSCKKRIHPADYVYKCLECKMELMQPEDPMAQLILKYIMSTCDSGKTLIRGIYKISRRGEDERFKNTKLENRRLLWHGTSACNLLSILCRGLVVSHCNHGARFGQGIYFADRFAKSQSYAGSGYMLLCEVALGEPKYVQPYEKFDENNTSSEVNSIISMEKSSMGKYDWLKVSSGASVHLSTDRRMYTDNEYVVQDPAQVCIRYLINFEN